LGTNGAGKKAVLPLRRQGPESDTIWGSLKLKRTTRVETRLRTVERLGERKKAHGGVRKVEAVPFKGGDLPP